MIPLDIVSGGFDVVCNGWRQLIQELTEASFKCQRRQWEADALLISC